MHQRTRATQEDRVWSRRRQSSGTSAAGMTVSLAGELKRCSRKPNPVPPKRNSEELPAPLSLSRSIPRNVGFFHSLAWVKKDQIQQAEEVRRLTGFTSSLSWATDKVKASALNLNVFLFCTQSGRFSAAVTTARLPANHTLSALALQKGWCTGFSPLPCLPQV